MLRSGYFFLLIIALLGPSFGNVKKEIKSISKEIYFVTDISLSMDAVDILPSRLEKIKQELKKMAKSFSSDRVGIIAFSSSAFVHCPPTYDQSALNLFIETLSTSLSPNQGSDPGEGVRLAIEQHKRSKENFNKVIILISDGEDFSDNLNDLASDILRNKIYLSVMGVGTEKGSKIPFNGAWKKDKENNEVVSTLKSNSLKEFAEKAEGTYFEISDSKNESEYLINSIANIEGTLSETREVDANANKYLYFLTFAFILIIIDVLITVRTVKIA